MAAPSLCIVRCGSPRAADCLSVTCGRRRDLSKNPRPLQLRSLGRVSVAPRFTAYRERSSLLNGDTRLLERIPEFGPVVVDIFCKGIERLQMLVAFVQIIHSFHCAFTTKLQAHKKKLVELWGLLCKGWTTI